MSKVPKKAATKVVEASVSEPKNKKVKTKRFQSWEVWAICDYDGIYVHEESHATERKAERDIASGHYTHPVIVHIDIPPMEFDR